MLLNAQRRFVQTVVFLTAYFGRLYRRELQWSSWDEIKACTSVLAVSVDINFLIRDRLRR